NLRAVPAQGAELQTPVERRAVPRLAEAREALFVGLPVSGRDDNLGEPSTKDVLRWPTEQLLGLGVPAEDQPFDIDGDDGVERAREGQPAALFTLAQGLLRISKLRGDAFGPHPRAELRSRDAEQDAAQGQPDEQGAERVGVSGFRLEPER